MGAQVVLGEPGRRGDRGGDLARVERIGPLDRDPPQRRGELGQRVALADGRARATARGAASDHLWAIRARADDARRRGVGRGPDGALEPEPPEALREIAPEPHRAGHRHRARPVVVARVAAELAPASAPTR